MVRCAFERRSCEPAAVIAKFAESSLYSPLSVFGNEGDEHGFFNLRNEGGKWLSGSAGEQTCFGRISRQRRRLPRVPD